MIYDREFIITEGCSASAHLYTPNRYKGKWYRRFLRRLKRLWRMVTKSSSL